jgi:hypothetical protein
MCGLVRSLEPLVVNCSEWECCRFKMEETLISFPLNRKNGLESCELRVLTDRPQHLLQWSYKFPLRRLFFLSASWVIDHTDFKKHILQFQRALNFIHLIFWNVKQYQLKVPSNSYGTILHGVTLEKLAPDCGPISPFGRCRSRFQYTPQGQFSKHCSEYIPREKFRAINPSGGQADGTRWRKVISFSVKGSVNSLAPVRSSRGMSLSFIIRSRSKFQ